MEGSTLWYIRVPLENLASFPGQKGPGPTSFPSSARTCCVLLINDVCSWGEPCLLAQEQRRYSEEATSRRISLRGGLRAGSRALSERIRRGLESEILLCRLGAAGSRPKASHKQCNPLRAGGRGQGRPRGRGETSRDRRRHEPLREEEGCASPEPCRCHQAAACHYGHPPEEVRRQGCRHVPP